MKTRLLVGLFMAGILAICSGCVGYSGYDVAKNADGTVVAHHSGKQIGLQLPNSAPVYTESVVQVGSTESTTVVTKEEATLFYYKDDPTPYEYVGRDANGKKQYRPYTGVVHQSRSD